MTTYEANRSIRLLTYVCSLDSQILTAAIPFPADGLAIGQQILEALKSTDGNSVDELWQSMLQSGHGFHACVAITRHADHDTESMMLQATPFSSPSGEALVLVTLCSQSVEDTTGPDEVARSRAVLKTAVDAIITIDARGLIVSMNPATVRMFGYMEHELLGRNIAMLMPEPYTSEHDQYVHRYLDDGQPRIIGAGRQVSAKRKDGMEFPVHLAISEFSVGTSRFFTGIVRDLTDLDHVQKQLLQSERLAAIGQMVTGLAHESRNALQRAQACLDMLTLDLHDQLEQLDLARRAKTALQDLHRLYEEVRIYAAPIHLELREHDLSATWRKEWENLASVRQHRNFLLTEDVQCESCHCDVDIHRMEQVFQNILENAILACNDQGIIHVQCQPGSLNGHSAVCINISDDGPGMPADVCQRIFEPFFTTRQKGTGLGMAIVQRIVSAHGGIISAGSSLRGGAEIRLTLPAHAAHKRDA